jgi:hypothetical protein
MKIDLSHEMNDCLNFIEKHGEIIRYSGGFWAEVNAEMLPLHNGGKLTGYYPKKYFGTNTIEALVKRNLIFPTEYKNSKYGKYPVKYKLK